MIDVLPDGTAYNLDETIQRLRYRDGDDKHRLDGKGQGLQSDADADEHQQLLRRGPPHPAGSGGRNFPRFDRNLNTGGNNYDETTGRVAHTAIHHSEQYPSTLTLSVVKH